MKLSQIRYFLEVAKYRNITQASKKLYVSQPTITVAIKELEKELEIDLFHREKQRIFLTDDGNFFYEEALQIVERLDNLVEVVKDKKKESIKDSDDLIEVPFKNPMSVNIGMEWKRKKYQNSSMKSFIEYLRNNYELYNL